MHSSRRAVSFDVSIDVLIQTRAREDFIVRRCNSLNESRTLLAEKLRVLSRQHA